MYSVSLPDCIVRMAEMRQGRKEAAVMAARIFVAVASGSRSCITLNFYRRKGRKGIYHIVPLLNTLQMKGR